MCDYSLHLVASRPAKVGDKLVTTKFNNSLTRGFAAVGEPNVAVCVLPGTEVAFEQEVEYCHSLLPNQKVAESDVVYQTASRYRTRWRPPYTSDVIPLPDRTMPTARVDAQSYQ